VINPDIRSFIQSKGITLCWWSNLEVTDNDVLVLPDPEARCQVGSAGTNTKNGLVASNVDDTTAAKTGIDFDDSCSGASNSGFQCGTAGDCDCSSTPTASGSSVLGGITENLAVGRCCESSNDDTDGYRGLHFDEEV